MSALLTRIYVTAYFCFDVAFAAWAWTHWGPVWGMLMFLGWPVWMIYHYVVLRIMP